MELNIASRTKDHGMDQREGRRVRMRLLVAAVAVMAVLALALSACGNSSFEIEGNWKATSDSGSWGQVMPGAAVVFDGSYCNVYSPRDTYVFEKTDNGGYELTVTGLLTGTTTFDVEVLSNDHIQLVTGSTTLDLER